MPIELQTRTEADRAKCQTRDVAIYQLRPEAVAKRAASGITLGENEVEYIACAYNVKDSYGSVFVYGAFRNATPENTQCFFNHDRDKPVGKHLEIRELPPFDELLPIELAPYGGLYCRTWLNPDTEAGQEAYSNITNGVVRGYSTYFYILEEKRDEVTGSWTILLVDLWEAGPVSLPSNPGTMTIQRGATVEQRAGKAFSKANAEAIYTKALATLEAGKTAVTTANELIAMIEPYLTDQRTEGNEPASTPEPVASEQDPAPTPEPEPENPDTQNELLKQANLIISTHFINKTLESA